MVNGNTKVFLALMRSGLWEQDVRLSPYENKDFNEVFRLAKEQSVVGLVTAGIEHVQDVKVPKGVVLMFVGKTLQLEQRKRMMNHYVSGLIEKLRQYDINALLVKGQGIAQCYEKPLWRSCGDIDLLLTAENYEKAKKLLIPIAATVETEFTGFKHLGMTLDGWVVELHGTLHTRLSKRVDEEVDKIQELGFKYNEVRVWRNEDTDVFLPAPKNDAVFIFTHILHHFYLEGIGLRQICDWCRFLWAYQSEIDRGVLESRIKKMGLLSEWRAFAALTVDWLGMPSYAMPLYSPSRKWSKKAERIIEFMLETGNFGHNRQLTHAKSRVGGKILSAWHKMKDFVRHARLFPCDSVKFFFYFLENGIEVAKEQE